LVVAHNHPSGDPSPSREDREITARLRSAGDIIGIGLIDHLVLGDQAFFSFAEGQTLPYPKEES
jgi:DNA repair protein RadC